MRKILFAIAILGILLAMSCDNEPLETENTPENVFAGKAWEYKSYNGDILQVYKKISFTKNEFTVYEKIDNTNTPVPPSLVIIESTITGTYSLFYNEEPNPEPTLGLMYFPSLRFTSDDERMNGTVTWSFSIPFSDPDGSIVFYEQSGNCTLITLIDVYKRFASVN